MITRVVFEFAVERVVGGDDHRMNTFSGDRRVERMRIGAAPSVRSVPFFQRWRACEPGEEPTAWWTEPGAAGAQVREATTDSGRWEQAPLGDVPPELLMTLGQLLAGGPGPRGLPRMEATTERDALVIKLGTIGRAPFCDGRFEAALPGALLGGGRESQALVSIATALGIVVGTLDAPGWTDRIHDVCMKAISDLRDIQAQLVAVDAFLGVEQAPLTRIEVLERLEAERDALRAQLAAIAGIARESELKMVKCDGEHGAPACADSGCVQRTPPPPLRKPDPYMHAALVAALGYAPGSVTWSRCLALVRETIEQRNEARTERDALKERAGQPTKALRAQLAAIAGIAQESDIDASLGIIRRSAQFLRDENEGRRWPWQIDTLDTLAQALVNDLKTITGAHDRLAVEAQDRFGVIGSTVIGSTLQGDSSIVVKIVTDYKRHLPIFLIKRRSDTTTALGTFFKIRCKTCHAWRPDSVADTVVAISKHLREAHGYELGWRWTQRPATDADWLVSLE